MTRYAKKPEAEPEPDWTKDHDWLAVAAQRIVGAYPGPRTRLGGAIRSWSERHGWSRVGRVLAAYSPGSVGVEELVRRMDSVLERGTLIEPQPLPEVAVPADAMAIGVCVSNRLRGRGYALHPTECGWCPYPLDRLVLWLEAFNAWTTYTPEGRSTLDNWWRTDRMERVSAIGASQTVG